MSRSASSTANQTKSSNGQKQSHKPVHSNAVQHANEDVDESSSSDDDDDEPIRAPMQLKIEFVNSVMFRQWELAKKLCQFMLMYEPDNSEAKQFSPLIDYMLAREESSSSSSSSDDETSDDDDDEDNEKDSSDSSDSSSTSSDNEEYSPTEPDEVKAPKPVNASHSHKCAYH